MEHNGQVSVAVRVNGELRAVDTELPRNAVFPIYSITKTLTAICVLRLAEKGLLRLGDAARQWLPEVDLPAAITLTHLLRHTSGLRDYGPLPEYHQAVRMHPGQPWTRQDFLDAVLPRGLLFARERVGRTRTSDTCCSSTQPNAPVGKRSPNWCRTWSSRRSRWNQRRCSNMSTI